MFCTKTCSEYWRERDQITIQGNYFNVPCMFGASSKPKHLWLPPVKETVCIRDTAGFICRRNLKCLVRLLYGCWAGSGLFSVFGIFVFGFQILDFNFDFHHFGAKCRTVKISWFWAFYMCLEVSVCMQEQIWVWDIGGEEQRRQKLCDRGHPMM